jgi:hypothetical protein
MIHEGLQGPPNLPLARKTGKIHASTRQCRLDQSRAVDDCLIDWKKQKGR